MSTIRRKHDPRNETAQFEIPISKSEPSVQPSDTSSSPFKAQALIKERSSTASLQTHINEDLAQKLLNSGELKNVSLWAHDHLIEALEWYQVYHAAGHYAASNSLDSAYSGAAFVVSHADVIGKGRNTLNGWERLSIDDYDLYVAFDVALRSTEQLSGKFQEEGFRNLEARLTQVDDLLSKRPVEATMSGGLLEPAGTPAPSITEGYAGPHVRFA